MTDIEIKYALTVDEAVKAMQSRVSGSWSMRYLWIATGLFTLITVGIGVANGDLGFALAALMPAFIVVGLYIFIYASPFTHERISKESRFFIEQTWRFTDDETTHRTAHGESRNAWSAYAQASETSRFFFLFLARNIVAPIPKRAFKNAEQMAQFRALLKRKLKFTSM